MMLPAFALAALLGWTAPAPIASATTYSTPPCAEAPPDADVCRLAVSRDEAEARRALGEQSTVWFADGDRFVVFARRLGDQVRLCCASSTPMDRIGQTDLWSVTLRVRDLDRAVIDVLVNQDPANTPLPQYRGPNAAPDPAMAETLAGRVTDEFIDSPAAGEHRKLSIYTPPGFDLARRYPVVYLPDGQVLEGYGRMLDPLILKGQVRPVVLVALWPYQGATDVNWRRLDWVVGVDPARFARVEAFFINEVIPLAERKYGASPRRQDRMLWGTSAGAAWVLAMSARHPQTFGHVAALSGGSGPAAEEGSAPGGPRLFLAAGRFEPEYLRVTRETAERARANGREVELRETVGGHSFLTWRPLMIEALAWAFGEPKGSDGL